MRESWDRRAPEHSYGAGRRIQWMASWRGAVRPHSGDPARQRVWRRHPEGKGHSHSIAELESDEISMWILVDFMWVIPDSSAWWGGGSGRD